MLASLASVGNVATLTSVGIYLHQKDIISPATKSGLARISSQVTIPLLLFTNVINCNQDWSDEDCPDMRSSLADAWVLIFYPLWVVGWGLVVGKLMAWVSGAPPEVARALIACVAFGSSTGLPLTLLAVIHDSFSKNTELGHIDPSVYLSVYLLSFPVLQWGIGTWILEPQHAPANAAAKDLTGPLLDKVNVDAEAGLLVPSAPPPSRTQSRAMSTAPDFPGLEEGTMTLPRMSLTVAELLAPTSPYRPLPEDDDQLPAVMKESLANFEQALARIHAEGGGPRPSIAKAQPAAASSEDGCLATVKGVVGKVAQPACLAAAFGMTIACLPAVRGLLVDIKDRDNDAPLQWLFNGLYDVGQAAVPINMMILGCSLAKGARSKGPVLWKCNLAATFGKMVIMPAIGLGTAILMHATFHINRDIDAPFFLVVLIVTCTPTANSTMVMAELAGQNKQAVAMCIFTQYCFAPILLTAWVTVFVSFATKWDHEL